MHTINRCRQCGSARCGCRANACPTGPTGPTGSTGPTGFGSTGPTGPQGTSVSGVEVRQTTGTTIAAATTSSTSYVDLVSTNITTTAGGELVLDSSFSANVLQNAPGGVGNANFRLVIDAGTGGEIVVAEAATDTANDNNPIETEVGAILSGAPIAITAGLHTVSLQWRVQAIGAVSLSLSTPGHATIRATEIAP